MQALLRLSIALVLCVFVAGQTSASPPATGFAGGAGGGFAADAAEAPSGPPHLLGLPVMPSDGALLVENPNFRSTMVMMLDARGASIEGSQYIVSQVPTGLLEAWKPAQELALGSYRVTLLDPDSGLGSQPISVEVVGPFSREPPAIVAAPSTSEVVTPIESQCCSTPQGDMLFGSCFVTEQALAVLVGAGLSTSATSAEIDQYLFRLVDAGEGAVASAHDAFMPFTQLGDISFQEARSEAYCLQLQAQNVATLDIHTYADPICAPGSDHALGSFDVDPEDRVLARSVCPVPPPGFEDRWCEINDRACDTKPSADCELYDYVCNDGPLPSPWFAAGSRQNVASEGCSARTGVAPRVALSLWLPVLALLAVARRRHRRA